MLCTFTNEAEQSTDIRSVSLMINSCLVPERSPKGLDYNTWNEHTPEEHKWELWEGIPFSSDGVQRD